MVEEFNTFFSWCKTNLSQLLGFPVGNDMITYVLSFENQREIEEHLGSLLDVTNNECKTFLEEFFKRWKPPVVNSKPYKKYETTENLIKTTIQKKQPTVKVKEETPEKQTASTNSNNVTLDELDSAEESPTKMSVDVRGADFLDKNKPMEEEIKMKSSSPFKKKNLKYVPLYSADGKVKTDVVMLQGRHPCQCLAQKHKLVNNCSDCGRIVCEQEGSGPCMFCGNLVCSPEEREIIARESKQGRKLREKLMNQSAPDDSVEKEDASLKKAIEHKNRLLEFDKNCTKRTKVIDDEADYFSSDNRWLTKKQRDAVAKRDRELRDKRFASRLDKKFTIDFAGRKVVDIPENNFSYIEEDTATPIQSLQKNDVITDVDMNERFPLIDPRISVKPPQFQSPTLSSTRENVTAALRMQQEVVKNMLRVQDKELQEMVDQGMCMSMHQPWASLLVHGIKKLEGRSWYTPHRGRLWIASTAQKADKNTVWPVEEEYRMAFADQNKDVRFPSDYPESALLGCVNVVDCASNEEYFQKHPDCTEENSSAYLFVCENPEQLRIKFQIKGKHKIYKLESHIHAAARKNLISS